MVVIKASSNMFSSSTYIYNWFKFIGDYKILFVLIKTTSKVVALEDPEISH